MRQKINLESGHIPDLSQLAPDIVGMITSKAVVTTEQEKDSDSWDLN